MLPSTSFCLPLFFLVGNFHTVVILCNEENITNQPRLVHHSVTELGVSRILGLGYDICHGNPFADGIDPGLLATAHNPEQLLRLEYSQGSTCPEHVICNSQIIKSDYNRKFNETRPSDRQESALHVIKHDGNTAVIAPSFGVLDDEMQRTLRQFDSVDIHQEYRLDKSHEAKIKEHQTLAFSAEFDNALCSLPDNDTDGEFVDFYRKFGTHVVVEAVRAVRHMKQKTFSKNRGQNFTSSVEEQVSSSALDVVTEIHGITSFVDAQHLKNTGNEFCRAKYDDLDPENIETEIMKLKQNLENGLRAYLETCLTTRDEHF